MIVIFDIDDVCLNYRKGFLSYFASRGVQPKTSLINSDDNLKSLFGVTSDQIVAMVKEFNTSEEFGKLESFITFEEYDELGRLSLDHDFYFLSSCGDEISTQALRAQNVILELFPFEDLICIRLGESKLQHTQKISEMYNNPRILFFDDNLKNLQDVSVMKNVLPFMVDHTGKSTCNTFPVLYNTQQMIDCIKAFS